MAGATTGCNARREGVIRRLAVLRPAGPGDLLMAVPALRALREGFPETEITLVSLPWAGTFVHRFSHYVDRFMPFYGFPDPRDEPSGPFSYRPLPRRKGDDRYDLVVQLLDGQARSNGWARALGGRMTVGYFTGEAPRYLTLAASYPEGQGEVERLLHLTRLIGCPARDDALEFPLFIEDHAEARRALSPGTSRPSIVLHAPDGADAGHAATVVDALGWDGHTIALTGPGARAVRVRLRVPVGVLDQHLSLGGLAAVLARVAFVVAGDDDVLRLAESVGTPVLGLQPERDPVTYLAAARATHTQRAVG